MFYQKGAMDPADWSSYRYCRNQEILGSTKHNSLLRYYFLFQEKKQPKEMRGKQICCFKNSTDFFFLPIRNKIRRAYNDIN